MLSVMPSGNDSPRWPSLYSPGLEILHIEHHPPIQPGGSYLYHAKDVFRFTLYWMFIFYIPVFILCGLYAFWNYAVPPSSALSTSKRASHPVIDESIPLESINSPSTTSFIPRSTHNIPKQNERRSRVAFALIVLSSFLVLSVAGSVVGAAITGFVTAGLYQAAGFHMSTWIPFLLAGMQVVIGLLSIWPSIVEII